MTEAPFLEVPAGVDIARWFVDEVPNKTHGCEGIDLWRGEDTNYCYLWITSTVDLDMSYYWLLDIRTSVSGVPFGETRDFLFVASGAGAGIDPFACEWFNHPIQFSAPAEQHRQHLADGLEWFASRVTETQSQETS